MQYRKTRYTRRRRAHITLLYGNFAHNTLLNEKGITMFTKPTVYRIELYPDSFINDPVAGFCSTTPFIPFQVGDQVDPFAWSDGNEDSYSNRAMVTEGCILEVVEIRHLMMIQKDNTIQSVSVRVVEKLRPE